MKATSEPPVAGDAQVEALPIAEVARRTGLSADTLRYYEKAGLIDAVRRTPAGVRRYAAADLDWLAFLLRLRDTGMSIADMRLFADLRRLGNESVPARLDLLSEHRQIVDRRIRDLRANLRALDRKISHYRNLLEEQ
ncbi:MerR family transcriptional regulator [Streptosporangium sp. NPDC002544]|uniref:MerR family transcriptional regulator n=1 Tax=Streptosporangium sp. NPDC002544 TaxID=3154538 RepID=UPI00331657A9